MKGKNNTYERVLESIRRQGVASVSVGDDGDVDLSNITLRISDDAKQALKKDENLSPLGQRYEPIQRKPLNHGLRLALTQNALNAVFEAVVLLRGVQSGTYAMARKGWSVYVAYLPVRVLPRLQILRNDGDIVFGIRIWHLVLAVTRTSAPAIADMNAAQMLHTERVLHPATLDMRWLFSEDADGGGGGFPGAPPPNIHS